MLQVPLSLALLSNCWPLLAATPASHLESSSSVPPELEEVEHCKAQSLLQVGRSPAVKVSDTHASVSVKVERVEPQCEHRVAWLHIPKAGTSLGNTLFHFANSSLPAEARLPAEDELESAGRKNIVDTFLVDYPIDTWFQGCFWLRDGRPATHQAITTDAFNEFEGDFVAMFREPSARAYSSWKYFSESANTKMTQSQYATQIRGLVTKMLTGQSETNYGRGFGGNCSRLDDRLTCDYQSEPDLPLALERLDGFKFIGLTEHWNLSICLFHKMLGGSCSSVEFENVRPAYDDQDKHPKKLHSKAKEEPEEPTWDYTDAADSAVYAKASKIFWSNVWKYNLTEESCASMCT